MAELTAEQRANIKKALKVAKAKGATRREQKALVEAMGVESNYRHLPYGDRDSTGILQQRDNGAWGKPGESVETDVAQLLNGLVTLLEHTRFPRLLAAFIDAAERDPALSALHADLTQRRREPLLRVLDRAREGGRLPPDLDPEVVTDLLTGPFFYRRFIAHRPIPPGMVEDVIAEVLTGGRP